MNWPAFWYGFRLLGVAALAVLLGIIAAADDANRQFMIRNLMFAFLIVYVLNIAADSIRKQLPDRKTETENEESE